MIVDASAIVAMMLDEPGARELADRLEAATTRATHAVSIYEAALAIGREWNATPAQALEDISAFLSKSEIDQVALSSAEAAGALDAFSRYGKGRHPARLNMGDCFSYACARLRGLPLLYKGDDFTQTDLA